MDVEEADPGQGTCSQVEAGMAVGSLRAGSAMAARECPAEAAEVAETDAWACLG